MYSEIMVTIKDDGVYQDVTLDPMNIHHIKPSLGGCTVVLDSGKSFYIYQDEKELTRRIRESARDA